MLDRKNKLIEDKHEELKKLGVDVEELKAN